jgi:acyl-CoA thioester hydrolase
MLSALREAGFRFKEDIKVRWAEIDPQRVVFNAHYMTYIDVAITEYLVHLFQSATPEGLDIMLVRAEIDFRQPARGGDRLQVGARCARLGRSSFTMAFQIRRESDEALLVEALLTYVNVNPETGRAAPIAEHHRQRFREFDRPEE